MTPIIKITFLYFGLVILFFLSISPAAENVDILLTGKSMAAKPIGEVLRESTKAIMSVPGVVGMGQGLCGGKPCIKVFVIKKTPDLDQRIPETLGGHPVVVEETGKVKALQRNQDE